MYVHHLKLINNEITRHSMFTFIYDSGHWINESNNKTEALVDTTGNSNKFLHVIGILLYEMKTNIQMK